MSRWTVVGLWALAFAGALAVLLAPATPWILPVAALGLAVCLAAACALAVALVRR
jgi:hypothetical protein